VEDARLMWRRLLGNRYTIVLGLLAAGVAAWNLYVIRHDQGIVEGRVLDAAGRPAAGASVALFERTLTTLELRATAQTDGDGRFRFTGQPAHHLVLEARHAGGDRSPRMVVRRYFRGQNLVLADPLRLHPMPSGRATPGGG
jgi:5-hydroxyisourate hydrolase-like protein (transthyretin family)